MSIKGNASALLFSKIQPAFKVQYTTVLTRMLFQVGLVLTTIQLVYAASIPSHEHGREPSPQCDPGEEDDCTKCYDALVNELIINDRNRYNMQQTFFPPDKVDPVFVEITFVFTRNLTGDGTTDYDTPGANETWFWTRSTIYLFQPIESMQFTSLFFADPSMRRDTVILYLQPRCNDTSDKMMMLLTQRVS